VLKGEKRGKEDMLIYLVGGGVRPVLDCHKDPYETFFLDVPFSISISISLYAATPPAF